MCKETGCKVRPSFNTKGESTALYCSTHKKKGMVDVINNPCIYPDCYVRPCFNKKGETKALYCSTHKEEGMVDVKHKTCIN